MYQLIVNQHDSLPSLAWLAQVSDYSVTVRCGSAVDVFEDGIFEGAWAGNFEDASFDQARTVMGSGIRLRKGDVIFVTPSHTLEALYMFKREREIYVSNSLVFLFQACDIKPIFDKDIGAKMASIVKGIYSYDTHIFATEDGEVCRFVYHNFTVKPSGKVDASPKNDEFSFSSFASYTKDLKGDLGLIVQNAASSVRRKQFSIITTCSSGYDSLTGAVLSTKFGCREALTLKNARGGEDDSGKTTGEAVGLHVHEFERVDAVDKGALSEAEFLATGMGGEDFVYKVFEPLLKEKVVLTGFHGDKIWDKHTLPKPGIVRGDISGASLSEFRLRVVFIHVPLPFIGAIRHDAMYGISNSEEMQPYSIGGGYDRPVPRRVIEEEGVTRTLFGQSKKAASMLFHSKPTLLSQDFRNRVRETEKVYFRHNRKGLLLYEVQKREYLAKWYAARILSRATKFSDFAKPYLLSGTKLLSKDLRTYEHNNPRSFFELITAIGLLAERYRMK